MTKKKNKLPELELVNPDDLESRKNSVEGLVYSNEIERIGKMLAKQQYVVTKLQYQLMYKQLLYKEFLGFKLSPEEFETLEQLEENKAKFADVLDVKE